MAYNGVQIDNSPNIIVITDSDANQITVTQPITRTVEVAALGPQGPVGPQGPTGSMAESNSGSFSITGSLTVSGSSTFTNIGPAIFSGSVNISGSAFYNGKEILTTAISGGFVTTSSFNAFTSSINAFTASYSTGSFTGSFTGSANLTSFSASSAFVTGNVTVLGTASINTLIVNQTQLSTGSNQLGDAADDTQTLYGTVRIPTGSLVVSGSSFFTGSLNLGTGTVLYGDTTTPSLVLDQTTGAYLKYGTTSEITVQGSTAILKASNTVQLRTGTATHLFVTSSGYVGIGTLAPTSKLQIATGSVLIDNNFSYRQKTSIGGNIGLVYIDNSDLMGIYEGKINVTSTGNVGVGITSPQARLHISSSATSTPTLLVGRASGQSSIKASSDVNGGYLSLDSNGSATIINHYVTDSIWLASGGGSVAVGHSSPQARLHVKGAGSTNSTYGLLVRNSNDSSSLVVLDNGNVGIGTTTPQVDLEVASKDASTTVARIRLTNKDLSVIDEQELSEIQFFNSDADGSHVSAYIKNIAAETFGRKGQLAFGVATTNSTNAVEALRIDENKNVGIGTTSPESISNTTTLTINGANGGGAVSFQVGGVRTGLINGNDNYLTLQSYAARALSLGYNGNNTIVISTSNNVGIGIISPTARLQVKGSGTTSATTAFRVENSNASGSMVVLDNGNVGIGTGTPTFKLQVISSTGDDGISLSAPSRKGVELLLDSGVNGGGYINMYTGVNVLTNRINAQGSSYINGGNVGIGTTTPSATLHISGASSANLLRIDSDASSSILFVSGSGNVGIGTSTPTSKFTIAGGGAMEFYRDDNTRSGKIYFSPSAFIMEGYAPTNEPVRISAPGTGTPRIEFQVSSLERMRITSAGNVGIGDSSPTSRLQVKGSGTTSATTTLLVQNANASASLSITDDLNSRFFGNVGIGTTPSASLHIAGNTILSGSAGTGSALTVYKSGSTVMSIQGSQGELFSITDSLSGSLFSVSNISGLPILEVFSDNTVLLGSYLDPMLITTQRVTANSGSTVIYSLPTASYDGVFVDYVIRSGSNARAGQFMGMWSGSSTNFTDNSTTDFGDTTGFIFGLVVSGSNMVLTGSASTSAWTVRAGIRSI